MNPDQANADSSGCPSAERLAAFSLGQLGETASEAIGEHVGACPVCESVLVRLDDPADGLFAGLRACARHGPFAGGPDFDRMVAGARAITPANGLGTLGEPPTVPALLLPETLGPYRLLERIGGGGMGVVYRAVHTRLKREVAVKCLSLCLRANEEALARFEREMEAVGKLDHPNIIRATDAGDAGGRPFLVMELIDGLDLSRLGQRCGALPVPEACEAIRQAALGLQHAHEHGLVHRDVKPSNLMVTRDGVVKVLDLGLSRVQEGACSEESVTGSHVVGTADFMAPEQALRSSAVDIRADVYALGCSLFKLLTGRAPFSGPEYRSTVAKALAHANEPIPPLEEFRHDIPAGLAECLDHFVAKAPAQRFATPGEAAAALEPFARGSDLAGLLQAALAGPGSYPLEQGAGDSANETDGYERRTRPFPGPDRVGGRPGRWRRRLVGLTATAGLVLVAVLGGLLLLRLREGGGSPQPEREPALAPMQWHPVLTAPPRKLSWADRLGGSNLTHKPKAQELWVHHTEGVALLGCGELEDPGYRLQVCLLQAPWTGGVGIFLGYRKDQRDGLLRYQVLALEEGIRNQPKRALKLSRIKIVRRPRSAATHARTVAVALLPVPDAEVILEVTVDKHRMRRVCWNGTPLPALAGGTVDKAFEPADYAGGFGTYNCASASRFRNFQLMILRSGVP
jgi:serine/threonine protein kinase